MCPMAPLGSNQSLQRIPPFTGRVIVRVSDEFEDMIRNRVEGDAEDLGDLLHAAREFRFEDLARVLERAEVNAPRLFEGFSNYEIKVEEDSARGRRGANGPATPLLPGSLMGYFALDVGGMFDRDVIRLLNTLSTTEGVKTAYREPGYRDPGWPGPCLPPMVTPDEMTVPGSGPEEGQGYLYGDHSYVAGAVNPKSGINAEAVWRCFGGLGVGFADLERAWDDHPELPTISGHIKFPSSPSQTVPGSHGTGVLGIVLADRNTSGIVGVAPHATLKGLYSRVVGPDQWQVEKALFAAIQDLSPGDVLLLEVMTVKNDPRQNEQQGLPIEVVDHLFSAIQLAVDKGIIVVESAGNGFALAGTSGKQTHDLDEDEWYPVGTSSDRSMNPTASGFLDSGAILVSGCNSTPSAPGEHTAHQGCTLGKRVDCFAWANDVLTTETQLYAEGQVMYQSFGGTSAAAAIVAGAAILVREMWTRARGGVPTPGQVRAFLKNPDTGTRVVDPVTGILRGYMPDLEAIANKIGVLPDVYIRDSLADIGLTPNPLVYQSPDIVVRRSPSVPDEFTAGRMTFPDHDEVISGLQHYVFVRVFNRGGAAAGEVKVTVYWSEPSALVEPMYWKRVGTVSGVTVPVEPDFEVVKIPWIPGIDEETPAGSACFIAVADHSMDPAPSFHPGRTTWQEFLAYIGNHNNMAWRNFSIIAPSLLEATMAISEPPGSKWMSQGEPSRELVLRGLREQTATFDFEFFQTPAAHTPVAVWLGIPPRLEIGLNFFPLDSFREVIRAEPELTWVLLPEVTRLCLGRILIPAGEEFRCRLGVAFDPEARRWLEERTNHRTDPHGPTIGICQLYQGLEVGRFTFQTKSGESKK